MTTLPDSARTLHIALIRQRYNPFGGAERFLERAIQSLQASGIRLTLVTRRWNGNTPANTVKRLCNPFHIGSLWRHWSFARCVCRTLEQEPPDLVQSHERLTCCDIYRAGDGVHREWLHQRQRTLGWWNRLVLYISPYHHYLLHTEQAMFQSPRLQTVICNSHMVKAEIRQHFGLPESRLHVIHNGVDTQVFHPGLRQAYRTGLLAQYGIPETATVYLYVGSGFERKGLAAVIRAFASQPADTWLLVVGKDRRMTQYRKLAQRLDVASRIHFAGGQQDVRPFYGAADVFLLPTLYDPFPNAALEAMACGLPIITSTKSGIAELIETGLNGYVTDALDLTAMNQALQQLRDPATRQRVGIQARQRVAHLTLENMGKQLELLYQTLTTHPA